MVSALARSVWSLLLLPNVATAYWPWLLSPELGQLYGCFIVTFAVGGALASRDSGVSATRARVVSRWRLTRFGRHVAETPPGGPPARHPRRGWATSSCHSARSSAAVV